MKTLRTSLMDHKDQSAPVSATGRPNPTLNITGFATPFTGRRGRGLRDRPAAANRHCTGTPWRRARTRVAKPCSKPCTKKPCASATRFHRKANYAPCGTFDLLGTTARTTIKSHRIHSRHRRGRTLSEIAWERAAQRKYLPPRYRGRSQPSRTRFIQAENRIADRRSNSANHHHTAGEMRATWHANRRPPRIPQ